MLNHSFMRSISHFCVMYLSHLWCIQRHYTWRFRLIYLNYLMFKYWSVVWLNNLAVFTKMIYKKFMKAVTCQSLIFVFVTAFGFSTCCYLWWRKVWYWLHAPLWIRSHFQARGSKLSVLRSCPLHNVTLQAAELHKFFQWADINSTNRLGE